MPELHLLLILSLLNFFEAILSILTIELLLSFFFQILVLLSEGSTTWIQGTSLLLAISLWYFSRQ